MTRFQKEINGLLGDFWMTNAIKEANKAKEDFEERAYVDDGVVRWLSNDSVPFDDMLEKMEYMGCKFDRTKSNAARDAEDAKAIEEYRSNQKAATSELLEEMRAVLGKEIVVVDVLSGQMIQL